MLVVHLTILAVTVLTILYAEHLGFEYFRGRKQTLSATIFYVHYIVWAGLVGMVITGLIMAGNDFNDFIAQPLFVAKMLFVSILFFNALFTGTLIGVTTNTPYAALAQKQKILLIVSGTLSTVGWVGAIVCARLFFG